MHKIPKEKDNFTIISWKELRQYRMDELAAHGIARNRLCRREIYPKKLLELFCNLP
jgi:hypothetical protein